MAYTRWSENDPRCDLYCYESGEDEFVIQVNHIDTGLGYDGQTIVEHSWEAFVGRIRELRDLGYAFPYNNLIGD